MKIKTENQLSTINHQENTNERSCYEIIHTENQMSLRIESGIVPNFKAVRPIPLALEAWVRLLPGLAGALDGHRPGNRN